MFNTLGKWIGDGFKWVLKKIGIGGENNPDTVNAKNVESAAEVASEIVTELKSNDKSDEVSNETNISKEDIVIEESKLDELIEKAVKKVYSKPQFKNSARWTRARWCCSRHYEIGRASCRERV